MQPANERVAVLYKAVGSAPSVRFAEVAFSSRVWGFYVLAQ